MPASTISDVDIVAAPSVVMRSSQARPAMHPGAMIGAVFAHADLIWQMARREVVGRYRGSVLGLLWSFFYPLLMLGVYTFAFSYVFKVSLRVGGAAGDANVTDFAFYAFSGLILFGLFTEVASRAPLFILQNANYVKKVVFPLEIFPFVYVLSALIHAAISWIILLAAMLIVNHALPWKAIGAPLALLPLLLMILGFGWFLASLGVFIRDVAQTIGVFTMMLQYLSPVFYKLDMVHNPALKTIIRLNPLTIPLLTFRRAMGLDFSESPWTTVDWMWLGGYCVVSCIVAWLGFAFFQRTKRGFADVL